MRSALAVTLFIVLLTARVHAEPVSITIAGTDDNAAAMTAVVSELLVPLAVEPQFARVESINIAAIATPQQDARPALARVWLDMTGGERATTYVVDAPWERVLIRHVLVHGAVDEVTREELAHIVASSVEALLAGGRIGIERQKAFASVVPKPPPPPEPPLPPRPPPPVLAPLPPTAPSDEPSPLRLGLGVFYELMTLGADGPLINGPGGALSLRHAAGSFQPGAVLTAQFRLPALAEMENVELELVGSALRLLAMGDLEFDSAFGLRLALGPGIDIDRVSPRLFGGVSGTVNDPSVEVSAVARAAAAGRLRLTSRLAFEVLLAADVALTHRDYAVRIAGEQRTILDPSRLRPVASIGLHTDLWGGE